MGKWGKYSKQHKKEWEQESLFQGWLTVSKDGTASYCKLCLTELRSHKTDLQKHSHTSKHKQKMSILEKNQLPIEKFGVTVSNFAVKKKELILASYVATHTSIRSINHLTDIVNNISFTNLPSSSLASQEEGRLHLHKTKCSALIKGVIAPSLLSDLIKDIGNSPYSIIVDESTDVSTEKLLCICIKYYSHSKNDVITQFLTFLTVVYTTAEDLFNVVLEYFKSINLNLQNLIGIGTDGGANLCGKNHSLFTLLKHNLKLDNLILVKCICHSLHLCSSKASEVFSDEVDFLLKETYNWFKNSCVRISKYKDIYNLINTDGDSNFRKLTQLSSTRWLSRYKAVDKILNQYLELETFFLINAQKEKCHTARILCETYQDKSNKVILTFLRPLLKQIYFLNLYFQKTNIDYYKAFLDINTTIWSLAGQILKPALIRHLDKNIELLSNSMEQARNFLNIEDCDLGYNFSIVLKEANLSQEVAANIKNKCFAFIKTLLKELIKRMPTHLDVFKKINNFSPNIILSHVRPKFSELPLALANPTKIADAEIEYRNILNIKWEEVFEGGIPDDSLLFWKKVAILKKGTGELMFKELSHFAFTLLILPSSNAVVERSFSIMNIVKSKIRNRMMLTLLNSIMIIRYHFSVNGICCKNFEPTKDMISRFNSKMYQINSQELENLSLETESDEVIELCNEIL